MCGGHRLGQRATDPLLYIPFRSSTVFFQLQTAAFHPGVIRYEYAKSTYRDDGVVILVFSPRPVTTYFRDPWLQFAEQYEFEPMFHPQLPQRKAEVGEIVKERLILVYVSPGFERNAFDLIVEALRVWADTHQRAHEWSLMSVGPLHADVLWGGKAVLRSMGTLSLNEYAFWLGRCWAGISFAFNASTSYSARVVAGFGAWVITNAFEYIKLVELPSNMIWMDESTRQPTSNESRGVANNIKQARQRWSQTLSCVQEGRGRLPVCERSHDGHKRRRFWTRGGPIFSAFSTNAP